MSETVQIDLQEGFDGDTVVVRIDGCEVARKEDVTTKLMLGYAETFEVQASPGHLNLEIDLPARNVSTTETLQVPPDRYLGVSIQFGGIQIIKSGEPFGYM